jgi:hypothetical protein
LETIMMFRKVHQEAAAMLAKLLAPDAPKDSEAVLESVREMLHLRDLANKWAKDAAPYVHPQLAAVQHRHTNADGTPIMPTVNIVIEGDPRPAALAETGPGPSDARH